jgi:hypothetical protein
VKVLYDEDRASHVGPQPCIMFREKHGEASARAGVGQPLNLENFSIWVSTRFCPWKTTQQEAKIASVLLTQWGPRTWHAPKFLTREPGDLKINHEAARSHGSRRGGEEP